VSSGEKTPHEKMGNMGKSTGSEIVEKEVQKDSI
jgi:hypothetical protein